ncbi:uncharacterized protein LOC105795798 [Gossypium raimondii]|uniref:uncharacterized protein LOC105795798 n=1 Tax=Gossypium raimondii TaxID=29730 RepID=UPI00063AD864|nr:uncharacterized protein LOC105795798 [Gossypium raimondii]
MPNLDTSETPVSPITETGSHDRMAGDDALSQAMLRILGRVTPSVAEYWMEVTERIMDNLDLTLEQKLKGAISLLRDEAYQWWLTIKEGTQPKRLTWDFYKSTFQGKYMGASYIDVKRREFLNLMQGDRLMAEYEVEFLRLSRYTRGMVAIEYERCVHFEDGLKDSLRVLIAPQRKRDFSALVKRQNRDKEIGITLCGHCGSLYPDECWRTIGACLRCGSVEHRVREGSLKDDQVQAADIGSTHFYVAHSVSKNLGISVESTSSEVTALSLLGQSIRVSKLYMHVPLEVQGMVFLADLMELPFR